MFKKVYSVILGAILVAVPVTADEAADKAAADALKSAVSMTKARQGYMQLQSQQLKAMGDASTGNGDITDAVVAAAQNLVNLTHMMSDVFAPGSGLDVVDFTRAVPELWTNSEERDNLIKRLSGQANRLLDTAKAGDPAAFQGAFKQLKGTCNKCHESFRAKKAPRDM